MPVTTSAPQPRTAAPTTRKWRHLLSPPASGSWNMALDEALLDRARETGETTLRVYSWSRPTLSLGRNQRAEGLYDLEAATRLGVDIVRRPTGGRAVLHHREVTYSITAPVSDATLPESYERINRLLQRALNTIGAEVTVHSGGGRAPLPDGSPCFEIPTVGELTLDNRKLVGSAQWREDDALLQHGSILIDDDQTLIAELSTDPVVAAPAPATLRSALGRAPSAAEIFDALVAAIVEFEDAETAALEPDDRLLASATTLEARYVSHAWTWRR